LRLIKKGELNLTEQRKEEYIYKKRIMASYGSRELASQWIFAAFGFSVFFFYESVIQLPTLLAALAYVVYSIWNAVNDPLIGWIMEKIHMPWEKKGFKRFPWLVIAIIPWLISYLLIYLVPSQWYGSPAIVQQNQWLIFGWYVGTLCFYDTMVTLYDTNVLAVYPEKFRTLGERRTTQGFGTILGILGLVLAAVPPMFFVGEDTLVASGYVANAWFSVGFGVILWLFTIPGIFEDKRVRDLRFKRKESGEKQEIEPFIKSTVTVVKDRNFMLKMIHFFGYQVGAVMTQTSAYYVVTYILLNQTSITILLLSMLIGSLISVPIWNYVAHKLNDNRKVGLIACAVLFVTFIPLMIVGDVIGWIISLVLFGVGIGANWYIDPPMMGDVLDDVSVRTGKTQYTIYYGFQAFFIKFGQTFIAITIALSHVLTGFDPANPIQTDFALFGIRVHTAIVPAILMLITLIIFWKWYDITPEKVLENKSKLKELGLERN
jgi:GPH family glycoside/pentoside/hexuronide:cation symporter